MIYCVEDDEGIRDIEVYTLSATGLPAAGFSGDEALFAAIRRELPELILLDVMLPGTDGVAILRKLRSGSDTQKIPVIMATAKGAEYDKITALDLGADDYLVKPFGMMEMVARVRAVLRRSAKTESSPILSSGELRLDTEKHTVSVKGDAVALTLKEYELLRLLLSHPQTVFTRDRLLSEIWNTDYDSGTRTVDVHIRTLRQKLGSCGDQIETVRGVGYRMGGTNG